VQEQPVVSFNVTSFDGYVIPTVRIDAMNGSSVIASQNVSDVVNLSQVHSFTQSIIQSYENATFRVVVNDTLFEEIASVNNVVLDALSQPMVTAPNTTRNGLYNVTWTVSANALGPLVYRLQESVNNGSWIEVNVTNNTYYLFDPWVEQQVQYRVRAEDDYFDTTYNEGVQFEILLIPSVSNDICAALTYPNELDAPSAVLIPVNFSVYDATGFTAPSVSVKIGAFNDSMCTYVQSDLRNRQYFCNVTMHYWYAADQYDLNVTYVDGNHTVWAYTSNLCEYGELLASARLTSQVTFQGAAPGVLNVVSTPAILLKNTGNKQFNVSIQAYNLTGQQTPASPLVASAFKGGEVLGSAVQMEHGVAKNLNVVVTPSNGSQTNLYLWLSMPTNAVLQSYLSTVPWVLTTTG
jgi:hypothetical protein